MTWQTWRLRRVPAAMGYDALSWVAALVLFAAARFGVAGSSGQQADLFEVCALAVVLHLGLGWVTRLYQGRSEIGSFEEVVLLGEVALAAGLGVTFLNAAFPEQWVPRSVPPAATCMALLLQAAGRVIWRQYRQQAPQRHDQGAGVRTLIMGVGDAGRDLLNSMLRDPRSHYDPVGFLDDDLRKRHRQLRGVPVLGRGMDLAEVAAAVGAELVVLAMPSAEADVVRRMSDLAHEIDIDIKVLPSVSELLGGRVGISDMRDIKLQDLLGRHQIHTDVDAIAGYLHGKRILVTGAGGSIGSELCRQLHHFSPAELIMLDRDESALHAVQLSISGRALLDSDDTVLGDIRDSRFLTELFAHRRPEVVFHAAALKHLPLLEQYPGEAIKTNVWGTQAVLDAAAAAGVERFVNISTDKAANPTSVLGYSKRIAEGLTAATAQETSGTFLSVRFGNVLGSRGSVITAFAAQIEEGGPVTVTHPDVTRYFMTVAEAVELVIQAAAIGRDGEALVLEMGSPVRIADVAQQLIDLSDSKAGIVFTGLRPGEKLHEELFGDREIDQRPVHPMVSHVGVPTLGSEAVLPLDPWAAPAEVVSSLAKTCAGMASIETAAPALRQQ